LLSRPSPLSATTGPTNESGTANSTATGMNQLSYWPASTR